MYDYIIVGSGLYGAIFAHEAMKAGKSCLVVERRSHIGGNIYTKDGKSSLFAVCIEYPNKKDLVVLPSGTYICANCSEEDREDILKKLLNTIKQKYEKEPEFIVQMVVISGILQWDYQIQIFLGEVEEIDN